MSIYTRTGDKGKTALFSGRRVLKSDLRIDCSGSIDELNSALGVVLSVKHQDPGIKKELGKIQNDLFEIGSMLADPKGVALQNLEKRVREFERLIDKMTVKMPVLKSFILPRGGWTGAMLHLSRAVCRRAERKIVALNNKEKINKDILVYINRLSDALFIMARFANFKEKRKETVWLRLNKKQDLTHSG